MTWSLMPKCSYPSASAFCAIALSVSGSPATPREPKWSPNFSGFSISACTVARALGPASAWANSTLSNLQPLAPDVGRIAQVVGRPLEYDLAVAHDVNALGDAHGDRQLLLHEQHRDALPANVSDHVGHDLDDLG